MLLVTILETGCFGSLDTLHPSSMTVPFIVGFCLALKNKSKAHGTLTLHVHVLFPNAHHLGCLFSILNQADSNRSSNEVSTNSNTHIVNPNQTK